MEQVHETSRTTPRSSPRGVVVVGAGRSGTSALTRGVQALGVDLGDRLKSGTRKNPKGFFEDLDLLDINKRLHRAFGLQGTGATLTLVGSSHFHSSAVADLHNEAVETLRHRFGRSPLWGFKSGGVLRLLPFWEGVFRALELEITYVVAIRNPLSVAHSRAKLDPERGIQEKSDLEWLVRVVPFFRLLGERPFVVVDYDRLMADPAGQLHRIASTLDLPLTEQVEAQIQAYSGEFLNPKLRHNRFTESDLEATPRLNPLTQDAYRWLDRLATDTIGPESEALWQDWQRIERELTLMAPVLRHVDYLEDRLNQTRWGLKGVIQALTRASPARTRVQQG